MALMHDGLRQNIKLSDARTSLQDISGSGSTTQPIKLSELGAYNLGKTNMFGVNYAIGDCYKPSSGATVSAFSTGVEPSTTSELAGSTLNFCSAS